MSQTRKYVVTCHDAGSAWCPCVPGEGGHCLACPVVARDDATCDFCLWSGTCVYDHHLRHRGPAGVRRFGRAPVLHREIVGSGLHLVRLGMPRSWEAELKRPGSFVMVKRATDDDIFASPMAACGADPEEAELTIVFQVRGAKTAALAAADQWAMKGPYRGALFGVRRLFRATGAKVLILVSGTGQSLLPGAVRQLLEGDNDIRIVVDPGLSGGLYVLDNLHAFGGPVRVMRFYDTVTHADLGRLSEIVGESEAELIVTLGSDFLHRRVARLMKPGQEWVASNNSIMVCADGVCGSCSIVLRDGTEIRGCKADVAPEDVFWRVVDLAAGEREG